MNIVESQIIPFELKFTYETFLQLSLRIVDVSLLKMWRFTQNLAVLPQMYTEWDFVLEIKKQALRLYNLLISKFCNLSIFLIFPADLADLRRGGFYRNVLI